MEFPLATGNAGTGMYQRGTDEHGCEFVPVARLGRLQIEIPKCPLQDLCGIRIQRTVQYSSQSRQKTVYNQEKHAPKNCWHFPLKNS